MQSLQNPTKLGKSGKRTRAMGTNDHTASRCIDDACMNGKPSKHCRTSGGQPLQQSAGLPAMQQPGQVTRPGVISKAKLCMQHCMPSPAVLCMYQPFLRQLAAGIAAGLAAGADETTKGSTGMTGCGAAIRHMPELQLPALQEAGINIAAFFQPMVQMMMMMMTAGAHSANVRHSQTLLAAAQHIPTGAQGYANGASAGAAADRSGKRERCISAHSKASKGAVAEMPVFNLPLTQEVVVAADAANTARTTAAACEQALHAQGELQLQHPFVSAVHHTPESPGLQQQHQLPAGTWMSSSSSSAISSWAGPAAGRKSPTTSITGMPPRPASTASKPPPQQQQQEVLPSPGGMPPKSSTDMPWVDSSISSALAANIGAAPTGCNGSTTAVGGVRVAPGPEDSQAINLHRQHILLLERRLGNMHPEVGQAYLALAQTLTQEGSMWSLAMAGRAHQRASQILESVRQRASASSVAMVEAAAAVAEAASPAVATAAHAAPMRLTSETADAYVFVTAKQLTKKNHC